MGACNSTLLDGALVYALVTASFLISMALACWFSMMPSLCPRCEQALDVPASSDPPAAVEHERCDDEHLTKADARRGGAH